MKFNNLSICIYIGRPNHSSLFINMNTVDGMVKHITANRITLQIENVKKTSTIFKLLVILKITSMKHGIDVVFCHLNICVSHESRRDGISL